MVAVTSAEAQTLARSDGLYFFLSHAHSEPIDASVDPDHWVQAVFHDLSNEVKKRPRERAGWRLGMFRGCAPTSAESDERMDRALDSAGVFVALRSESYHTDERAQSDQSAFYRQQSTAIAKPPQERLLPVLWEVPPGGAASGVFDDALAVLPDIPQYAETGLVALSRRHSDRDLYEQILAFLGEWIVNVADGRPPPAGRGGSNAPAREVVSKPAFVIAMLTGSGPQSPDRPASGADEVLDHRLRLVADRAAEFVDGFRFDVRTVHFPLSDESLAKRPGLLLIDSGILDDEDGEDRLRRTLDGLPRWIVPIMVAESPDPVSGPDESPWGWSRALGGPLWPRRPRMMPESDSFSAFIAAAIQDACRRFDAEPRTERPRRYPPRPRSNSDAEEF